MDWNLHSNWFSSEGLRLRLVPPGYRNILEGGAKGVIEWGLQSEWDFEEAAAAACLHRADHGKWPTMEPQLQFLISHRLIACCCHAELFHEMQTPVPATHELALMLLCVHNWRMIRYTSWLVFGGRQMSGPVHDPFDAITPPSWAQ